MRKKRKTLVTMPDVKVDHHYVSVLASKLARVSGGKVGKVYRREAKIEALRQLNTTEARKERKGMNVVGGKPYPTDARGFFGKPKMWCKTPSNSRHTGNARNITWR